MSRPIKKGSTDQSIVIYIFDSVSGLPETAVEHNTAGIDLWYRREGAVVVSITEVALAALTTEHTNGGIEAIGHGYYRLDPPDAAFAAGVNGVQFGGTVTDMVVLGPYVPLVDYDPYDSVRVGLTALPNAAADAAGGLPIKSSIATVAEVVNEWETQSQADPTGFHVNLKEVNGTAQTAGDIAALVTALNDIAASEVWDVALHGTNTAKQLLGILLPAFAAAKVTGAGTATITIRDTEDGFNAIVMTVDALGNRSNVVLSFS